MKLLKGLLMGLFRSRRVSYAAVSNGLLSLASLTMSVAIARTSSIHDFGAFALAWIVQTFCSSLVRSAFTNTALARPDDGATYSRSLRRASLCGLAISPVPVVWGLATSNGFLVILGASIHGLILLDFIRAFDTAAGSGGRALSITVAWSSFTLAISIYSIVVALDSKMVFLVWAASGAISGYVIAHVIREPIRPSWPRHPSDTRVAAIFALEFLVGRGSTLVTTGLLGIFENARILGAIRGAGTLLGPLNLVAATVNSLMLPFLARRKDPKDQLASAVAATILPVSALLPILVAVQFIPNHWGFAILGETWQLASTVLFPMSVDSIFALTAAVAQSGHRVAFAGRRAVLIRLVVGAPKPIIVLGATYLGGASGAAWSMAGLTMLSAGIWWVSYANLIRRVN